MNVRPCGMMGVYKSIIRCRILNLDGTTDLGSRDSRGGLMQKVGSSLTIFNQD